MTTPEYKSECRECCRCGKELKKKAWAFGEPSGKDNAYCIQCAKHIAFYEVISAHGRPYSFKPTTVRKEEEDE